MRKIDLSRINEISMYALAGTFKGVASGQQRFATSSDIWEAVQWAYDLTRDEILINALNRKRIHSEPRFLLMYLLYQFDERRPSLKTVGEEVGALRVKVVGRRKKVGFDHTSVRNAMQAITDWLESDERLRHIVDTVLRRLNLINITRTETISNRTVQSTRQWLTRQSHNSMTNSDKTCLPCYSIYVCPS
jgi:chromosomal replication initiation ATPase DnaA